MPAFAALTINDGTSPTPVARTYSPVRNDKGLAQHANRASGIPVGFPVLDVQLVEAIGKSTVHKVVVHMSVPTLAQTSPSTGSGIQPNPTKAYEHRAKVEFWLPTVGTRDERLNILALIRNALSHAAISAVIADLETMY